MSSIRIRHGVHMSRKGSNNFDNVLIAGGTQGTPEEAKNTVLVLRFDTAIESVKKWTGPVATKRTAKRSENRS